MIISQINKNEILWKLVLVIKEKTPFMKNVMYFNNSIPFLQLQGVAHLYHCGDHPERQAQK